MCDNVLQVRSPRGSRDREHPPSTVPPDNPIRPRGVTLADCIRTLGPRLVPDAPDGRRFLLSSGRCYDTLVDGLAITRKSGLCD